MLAKSLLFPLSLSQVLHVTRPCQDRSYARLDQFLRQARLIPLEGDIPLCVPNIVLLFDFSYPNLHAVLRHNNVLLLHLLASFVCDIVCDGVDDVANEAEDQEDSEEDEERG